LLKGTLFNKAIRKAMYDNTIGGMGPGAYFKEPPKKKEYKEHHKVNKSAKPLDKRSPGPGYYEVEKKSTKLK